MRADYHKTKRTMYDASELTRRIDGIYVHNYTRTLYMCMYTTIS